MSQCGTQVSFPLSMVAAGRCPSSCDSSQAKVRPAVFVSEPLTYFTEQLYKVFPAPSEERSQTYTVVPFLTFREFRVTDFLIKDQEPSSQRFMLHPCHDWGQKTAGGLRNSL